MGRWSVESYTLDKAVEINKYRSLYVGFLRGSYVWGFKYMCRTGRQGGGRPDTW